MQVKPLETKDALVNLHFNNNKKSHINFVLVWNSIVCIAKRHCLEKQFCGLLMGILLIS